METKEAKEKLWIFNLRFNEVIRTLVIYSLERDERRRKVSKVSRENNKEFPFVFIYSSNSCTPRYGSNERQQFEERAKKGPFKKQLKRNKEDLLTLLSSRLHEIRNINNCLFTGSQQK